MQREDVRAVDALVLGTCHRTLAQTNQVHDPRDPRVSSGLRAITTSRMWVHQWEEMHPLVCVWVGGVDSGGCAYVG